MLWLTITHQPQRRQADCLAACAKMVLDYRGIEIDYDRLCQTLRIGPAGARCPVSESDCFAAVWRHGRIEQGNLSILETHLTQNSPVIAFVDTGQLPDWTEQTQHALVVVGLEVGVVYCHDPAFADGPQPIPIADFDLAWLGLDEYYALFNRP